MVKAKKSASKMKRKSGNGKSVASKVKTASKKTSSKSSVMRAGTSKLPTTIKETLSKSAVIQAIAECRGLSKKEVTGVFDDLAQLIEKSLKNQGPGVFVLPGLLKIYKKKKPARPARKGVNPFTGEEMTFKAKPASNVIKIKALKKLKEVVA